jgi:hypothetical protein
MEIMIIQITGIMLLFAAVNIVNKIIENNQKNKH